jgi:peptidoglycan hydrolase-like protein with peptidoglycan-binding domain
MFRAPGPVIPVAALALALVGCLIGALLAGPAPAAPAGKASPPSAALPDDGDAGDAPELDDASYRDLVADAQRLLRLRGFDPGPVDGQLGLRTRRAIRAYQAEARARGVLEALKGPAPAERSLADLPGRPKLSRIEPAAGAATE